MLRKLVRVLFWLMMATSSVVLIEPAPTDLLVVLLLPLVLLIREGSLPRRITAPSVFLWLFLMGNVLSIVNAVDPLHALIYATITGYLVLLWMLVVAYIAKHGDSAVRLLWNGYLTAATLAVAVTVVAYFIDVPWREIVVYRGYRGKALFKDANVFGPFLVPAVLYCMLQSSRSARPKGQAYLVLAGFLTGGVILSFSRGAWLNLLASATMLLCGMAWFDGRKGRAPLRVALGVVLAVGALPFVLSVTGTREFFSQRAALQEYDAVRFTAQRQAMTTVFREPLGLGPGQANEVLIQNPHNAYLHVAAENGWVGAIGFICLIVLTLHRTFKGAVQNREPLQDYFLVIGAALFGVLLNSMVIDSLHWRHLWLLLAIPWGLPLEGASERKAPHGISVRSSRTGIPVDNWEQGHCKDGGYGVRCL